MSNLNDKNHPEFLPDKDINVGAATVPYNHEKSVWVFPGSFCSGDERFAREIAGKIDAVIKSSKGR